MRYTNVLNNLKVDLCKNLINCTRQLIMPWTFLFGATT